MKQRTVYPCKNQSSRFLPFPLNISALRFTEHSHKYSKKQMHPLNTLIHLKSILFFLLSICITCAKQPTDKKRKKIEIVFLPVIINNVAPISRQPLPKPHTPAKKNPARNPYFQREPEGTEKFTAASAKETIASKSSDAQNVKLTRGMRSRREIAKESPADKS